MLLHRVLTAIILLPLLLLLLIKGPLWSSLGLFGLIVGFISYEFSKMVANTTLSDCAIASLENRGGRSFSSYRWKIISSSVVISLLLFFASILLPIEYALLSVVIAGLFSMILACFTAPTNRASFDVMTIFILSMIYCALPWVAIWKLFIMAEGGQYLFLGFSVVWGGDTGAYFGGRFFGKHKLAPKLSPKKTIEGAICGLLSSALAFYLVSLLYAGTSFKIWEIVVISFVGGVLGQLGDLVESSIKRFANVKDSGSILPGHGGMLDRVDAVIFGLPAILFLLYVLRGY